ncbi:MAG: MobB mobilization protein [Synergistaceae bacterium]|nr:MobB mobilization protein [Synergistaceae bacterium]
MPRPRLNEDQRKEKRLTVRFRPEEMAELTGQADVCGLSVSELVRRRSLNKRVVPAADLKIMSELRRIGGLLKLSFKETNGVYGDTTAAILNELRNAIIRIGRKEDDR